MVEKNDAVNSPLQSPGQNKNNSVVIVLVVIAVVVICGGCAALSVILGFISYREQKASSTYIYDTDTVEPTTYITSTEAIDESIPLNRGYMTLQAGQDPLYISFSMPEDASVIIKDTNGTDTERTGYRGFTVEGDGFSLVVGGFYTADALFEYTDYRYINYSTSWGSTYRVLYSGSDRYYYTNSYEALASSCRENMGEVVNYDPPCGTASITGRVDASDVDTVYSLYITCSGENMEMCDEIVSTMTAR